ncbi:MFS transporter [Streptomyces sp. NPDC056626]|uniref:MFS transporter n=1 Tax=unclassified Streptomyces TaxID=2593676 RepID=UPI0036839E98
MWGKGKRGSRSGFLTGVFVFSAQVLVYAYVTNFYPASVRGTALGSASGIGRLGSIVGPSITGALVTAGVRHPWGFSFFAAVAALACLAVLTLPAQARGAERQPYRWPSDPRSAPVAHGGALPGALSRSRSGGMVTGRALDPRLNGRCAPR